MMDANNLDENLITDNRIFTNVIKDNMEKRIGLKFNLTIDQHSAKGLFFKYQAEVKIFFDFDLIDLTLFHQLIKYARQICVDEIFVRNQSLKFDVPIVELDEEEVEILFAQIYK